MIQFIAKHLFLPVIGLSMAAGMAKAKPGDVTLTVQGEQHLARYEAMFESVKSEITAALPSINPSLQTALDQAHEAVKAAEEAAKAAQKDLGTINSARGLVGHAKNKWIGDADKGIARAKEALQKASSASEREAAQKELAKWEESRKEGLAALAERQAKLDAALKNEDRFKATQEAAQAALDKAREAEAAASSKLLESLAPLLNSDSLDTSLSRGVILSSATPKGLAVFAQHSQGNAALIDQLFADSKLMQEMILAGGASFGEWGNAARIFGTIQKASPRANDGLFRRLAIATSVAHARPIQQSKPAEPADVPTVNVDPVKRYQHYEKAFLEGELDAAFEHLTAWELRHVVNAAAPDAILQWGRTMLRNYRPDHIYNSDYAWRYVATVRTEVPYGSQNVKYDIPTQHQYQNIVLNGGICGRRAFFGRFILRAFGIPTWGVTQRAHAAVGHWTPDGWVTVLGAGFHASWWDRDDVSMSGNQFLIETQARAHAAEFIKVVRAQSISRILGEPAYNDRRNVAGGFWSRVGLYQQRILAATARALDPVGQELAEANEREQQLRSEAVSAGDKEIRVAGGIMSIPAVAHSSSKGRAAAMKSFGDGMQLHKLGGFKADYTVDVPATGTYLLVARVATLQKGQQFLIGTNSGSPRQIDVPYTLGMWETTSPAELHFEQGSNTINVELVEGSKGVTVKEFLLKPAM